MVLKFVDMFSLGGKYIFKEISRMDTNFESVVKAAPESANDSRLVNQSAVSVQLKTYLIT